jgi:hypothetical protein
MVPILRISLRCHGTGTIFVIYLRDGTIWVNSPKFFLLASEWLRTGGVYWGLGDDGNSVWGKRTRVIPPTEAIQKKRVIGQIINTYKEFCYKMRKF